ncbi:hypothetical protein DPMN_087512 [Dreissena polymorpha]|uniref:HTH CENPB-type domain-containing protein n=1 Tax=Dreissena polymorpha TaxID=45954 RepID=A0A9D4QWF8_DREPO|nr:hypothetical protein DPMN_087512 [Dreissena polymorpha]
MFGVPRTTLRDRVSGHVNHDKAVVGGAPILSLDEERVLVDYVETLAQLGYGLTNERLKTLAGDLVFTLGRKKNNKPMSNNWLYGFLHRWEHQIASLSAKRLESTRAKSATPQAVDIYFKNLLNTLTTYNLLDKPHLIFNMDKNRHNPRTQTSKHYCSRWCQSTNHNFTTFHHNDHNWMRKCHWKCTPAVLHIQGEAIRSCINERRISGSILHNVRIRLDKWNDI